MPNGRLFISGGRNRQRVRVHIAMGSLVDAPSIKPAEHIMVGSKAPWFTITDDLPQYERHVRDGPPINR